jgi:hypothetical protein
MTFAGAEATVFGTLTVALSSFLPGRCGWLPDYFIAEQ